MYYIHSVNHIHIYFWTWRIRFSFMYTMKGQIPCNQVINSWSLCHVDMTSQTSIRVNIVLFGRSIAWYIVGCLSCDIHLLSLHSADIHQCADWDIKKSLTPENCQNYSHWAWNRINIIIHLHGQGSKRMCRL